MIGKRTAHNSDLATYSLLLDPSSEFNFYWAEGEIPHLNKADGSFGFSNVEAYMSAALVRFNGRHVTLDIRESGAIQFRVDQHEKVPEIWYGGMGNACYIPGKPEDICGLGKGPEATCIFLSVGGTGWRCEKVNDGAARLLLDRAFKGQMAAKRIGNCKLMGRKS